MILLVCCSETSFCLVGFVKDIDMIDYGFKKKKKSIWTENK